MDRLKNILKERLEAAQSPQVEHPSTDTLTAFVERSLKPSHRDHVLAHLAVCSACRQAVTLAAPESAVHAAVHARVFGLHFPAAMRWASVSAAVAIAVGVGLLHERSSSQRQVLSAPAAIQAPVPAAPAEQATAEATDKLEAKSQPKVEAPTRAQLTASASKKHQNRSLRALDGKLRNEMAGVAGAGPAGAVLGGLVGGQRNSARAANVNQSANGFVNGPQEKPQDLFVTNSQPVAKSAPVAMPSPASSQAGTAEQLQAFDSISSSAQQQSSAGNAQTTVSVPAAARTVEADAQPEKQLEVAVPPKVMRSAAIGGSVNPEAAHFSSTGIALWKISDTGRLQRSSPDGAATEIEPAPGLTVRAVAAEGIEVWAAGIQPDASAKQWQERPVLFHSSDAGKTWTKIEGPWQAQIVRLSLAVGRLTVVAKDGIWSTINAGKSWLTR